MDKPFSWLKKGLLFGPNVPGFTHASHPTIIHVTGDEFIIAFSARTPNQKSHIFLVQAIVSDGSITLVDTPKLALEPGLPGHFDCDGLLSCCIVNHNGNFFLYYSGWQNLPEGLWICDTGRAIINPNTLTAQREFLGPVFARDKHNPLFAAATTVLIDEQELWHTWYNSGIKWEKLNDQWKPTYGIHHATSLDGIDWVSEPDLIIPLKDKYEHSFGRPSVVKWNNEYLMWFAHRGTKDYSTYRIGFASSKDGLRWNRDDSLSGIDISSEGWDSDSVCYPYAFEHMGHHYLLYNGNNYGATGFGYAVLE